MDIWYECVHWIYAVLRLNGIVPNLGSGWDDDDGIEYEWRQQNAMYTCMYTDADVGSGNHSIYIYVYIYSR